MKKLVQGIVDFRRNVLPNYRETFAELALRHEPDALFISCSDSRVVPNLFASSDPGDLFVVRNVGNIIPHCGIDGHSSADESEAAAIEFALTSLNVLDIIVCGHSDCGAMHAILKGRENLSSPHLREWLRHADESIDVLLKSEAGGASLSAVNLLSQKNVLKQIQHLMSYPLVQRKLKEKKLTLHAWWFELSTANVFAYEEKLGRFLVIDEQEAERILLKIDGN